MLVVVVSFTGSLGYSHLRLRRSRSRPTASSRRSRPAWNAWPMRAGPAQLERGRERAAARPGAQRAATRQRMLDERDELDGALDRYRAMPALPGEAALQTHAIKQLEPLDDALHDVLVDAATARTERAARRRRRALRRRARRASAAICSTCSTSTWRPCAPTPTRFSPRARARAAIAIALGAFSLLAALIATVLALKTQQAQARLVAEHRQFLEQARAGARGVRRPRRARPAQPAGHDGAAGRFGAEPRRTRIARARARGQAGAAHRGHEPRHRGLAALRLRAARVPSPARTPICNNCCCRSRASCSPRSTPPAPSCTSQRAAPLDIACSPGALRSVLTNLLQNAVTHMQAGSRPARSINARALADEGKVRVEIEDTGTGFAAGHRARRCSSRSCSSIAASVAASAWAWPRSRRSSGARRARRRALDVRPGQLFLVRAAGQRAGAGERVHHRSHAEAAPASCGALGALTSRWRART